MRDEVAEGRKSAQSVSGAPFPAAGTQNDGPEQPRRAVPTDRDSEGDPDQAVVPQQGDN